MVYSSDGSSAGQPPKRAGKPNEEPLPENSERLWSNLQIARTALQRGVCLEVTYEGFRRVVEVHTLGLARRDGKSSIGAYQVEGDGHEETLSGWLLMCLDECFDVELSKHPSEAPRIGYLKGSKGFMRIDAEVRTAS